MCQPVIISIEGNIGAGKTTIVQELHKRFQNKNNIIFVKEPVDIWETITDNDGETILQKFYAEPSKYAFQFQVMALTTRLTLIRDTIRANPDCDMLICERSIAADKEIFAKMLHDDGLITDLDYKIYCLMANEHAKDFNVAGHIYINADADVCFKRIHKRSRDGEAGIGDFAFLDNEDEEKTPYDQYMEDNYYGMGEDFYEGRKINNNIDLIWDTAEYPDEYYVEVMDSMYLPVEESYNGQRTLDVSKLNVQ